MKKLKKIAAVCTASMLCLPAAEGLSAAAGVQGVVINEVCAKNTVYKAADGGLYDWVELYNSSGASADLSGYGLSDDSAKPYRYTFPEGTEVGAGQRIIVFCDSKIKPEAGKYTAAFGLSTSGETLTLTDPSGNVTDTVTFGQIDTDVSYGRLDDGGDELGFMQNPTPEAPNIRSEQAVEIEAPVFSHVSGFYDEGFSLNITAPEGMKIYYTLDGSDPDAESEVFSGPINVTDISSSANVLSARTDIAPRTMMSGVNPPKNPVDKAFIVRAAAADEKGNFSPIATASYFVGYKDKASYYKKMKVISLVTDSSNLFDSEKGIYVQGKVYDDWRKGPEYNPMEREWLIPGNYTQKGANWEREASMQVFDGGELAFSQNVGIRIHGGATRSMPQKSFNVYARSDYGASKLDFNLFNGTVMSEYSGELITSFDSFILRNGGNDGQYTRFRDKLNQALVSNRNILTQGMSPCIVFIDGEYWGHYEITEKLDEDFVSAHFGVKSKNICIVKEEELDAGDAETYEEWKQLGDWLRTADLSDDKAYEELSSKVDMQSFMDYISAEIYYNNSDWGSKNSAMWKSSKVSEKNPYSDGRWRFILYDTEYSTNLYGQANAQTNTFSSLMKEDCFISSLFKAALKNETFRRQFCTTFMDIANDNFDADTVSKLITFIADDYRDFAVDTFERFWSGGFMAPDRNFVSEVDSVRSFYQSRFSPITNALKNTCGLKGSIAEVRVRNDFMKGIVTVNTLSPDFVEEEWCGRYYTDYPVTLKVTPEYGYKLAYWETTDGTRLEGNEVELKFNSNITVTPVYEEAEEFPGDVNHDGAVNAADIVMLQKWLVKGGELDCPENAELCGDERINVMDVCRLRRIVLG